MKGSNQYPDWRDDEYIEGIAKININSRRIKNIARIALDLAHNEGRELYPQKLSSGVETLLLLNEVS
jgi:hypothetical protein